MIFSPCEKPVRQEERPYDEAGLRLARSRLKDKRNRNTKLIQIQMKTSEIGLRLARSRQKDKRNRREIGTQIQNPIL